MGQLNAEVLHVLQRQKNIISIAQLNEAGVARTARERLVRDSVLEHVSRSVLAVPGGRWTLERRSIALCLQHPQGYISGPTAGRLLAVRRMPRLADIRLVVPHGSKIDVPAGVDLRQTTILPPDHVRRLDNGITVANWARLAFDLAADLPRLDLASAIDQMIHRGDTDMSELVAIARLLCRRRRAGSRAFAAALLDRGSRVPTESHPEIAVLDGLQRMGVPVVPQLRHLELPNGGKVRIDMAVESVRWGVEVDVHPWHFELPGTTRDNQRDRQMHLIDWQVEHVTELDLLDMPAILAELEQLYRSRVDVLAGRQKEGFVRPGDARNPRSG
ncbi:MAG: hypothetical protein ACOYMR_17165 [Ilumatobacteraceae bacterium]